MPVRAYRLAGAWVQSDMRPRGGGGQARRASLQGSDGLNAGADLSDEVEADPICSSDPRGGGGLGVREEEDILSDDTRGGGGLGVWAKEDVLGDDPRGDRGLGIRAEEDVLGDSDRGFQQRRRP